MGRQVRFYILPEEEDSFLNFVLQRPEIKILRYSSPLPDFVIEREEMSSSPKYYNVYLWYSSYGLDPKYINRLNRTHYDENAGIFLKTKEIFYNFDYINTNVIAYSRPFFDEENKLSQSRIWAEMKWKENNRLVYKDELFIKWYEEIAKWLRKNLMYDKELSTFISQNVITWQKRGGILH